MPSLPYLERGPAQLTELNAQIDAAAVEAGRDPAAIRRLLNVSGQFTNASSGFLQGPPDQWAEDLAGIALEYGISGFIVMGDDPASIQRFGEEVVPAVRELVAAERSGTTDVPPVDVEPPSIRVSGRALWDESTRPVAPPPPDGQVYPERAGRVGRHLIDVHNHLRNELTEVRDLLEQVKLGAVAPGRARAVLNEMSMRQNNWTLGAYCAAYCTVITQHHGIEDSSVFPHLRRADPGLVPVLDRLEQEHVIIHEVVDGVDRALVNLVREPGDFTELQEAVDLLTNALLSHLSYEEGQIVEPLSRYGFYDGQL